MSARILVVDDEAPIRALLAAALQMAGYETKTAGDGREALALCGSEAFDAVISDVVMPYVSGHELAHLLATQCPKTRVILMSGFDPGCSDCPLTRKCALIQKPFRPADVVAAVRSVLPNQAN